MNEVKDLFLSPVTIIGGLLAIMFISMGYLRHLGAKRAHVEKERDIKPVKVTDPFAAHPHPVAHPPPAPSLQPHAPGPARTERTFRQFSNTGQMLDDKSGYIWE